MVTLGFSKSYSDSISSFKNSVRLLVTNSEIYLSMMITTEFSKAEPLPLPPSVLPSLTPVQLGLKVHQKLLQQSLGLLAL